jgi:hypothetical protein
MNSSASPRVRGATALPLAVSLAILAIGCVVGVRSLGWRGAPFPGFFLLPNRVVPSAGLPGWSGIAEGRPPFQEVLLTVDGTPVASGADGYRRAAVHREGDVEYLFARRDGIEKRSYPLRRFSDAEHLAVFGAYLVAGGAYLVLAFFAGARWRRDPLYQGLTAFAWASATFAFTGVDLYGPGTLFRLHVLSEAFLPAAAVHLALVCPRDRLTTRRGLLALVYGLTLAFAVLYEFFLFQPGAYVLLHNLAQGLAGVPVLVFTALAALALDEPPAALGPGGTRILLGAALAGIVVPGLVFGVSGLTGGGLPVNVSAWIGFLFPLGTVLALSRPRPR